MSFDKKYMELAIDLADKGMGKVNPNPLVGCIIVKNKRIIGKGYHAKIGEKHAEIKAIESAKESIEDSDVYVTLEPCSHYGKTPPCVDRLIEERVKNVFIGIEDPNPLVKGSGIKKLRDNGINVKTNILADKCKRQNEVFIKYIDEKKPFVVLKGGISLDGKIATKYGESKWITSEKSRIHSHNLRNKYSAIMVGINTVIEDNPRLNCRIKGGNNPIRIIVDSKLRIPLNSNIVNSAEGIETIIATTKNIDLEKKRVLESKGIEVLEVNDNKRVNLNSLMVLLGKKGIDSILIEGGGTLNFSALDAGIVDKIQLYISPQIIGGKESLSFIAGKGIENLKDSFKFKFENIKALGEDLLIEAYKRKE